MATHRPADRRRGECLGDRAGRPARARGGVVPAAVREHLAGRRQHRDRQQRPARRRQPGPHAGRGDGRGVRAERAGRRRPAPPSSWRPARSVRCCSRASPPSSAVWPSHVTAAGGLVAAHRAGQPARRVHARGRRPRHGRSATRHPPGGAGASSSRRPRSAQADTAQVRLLAPGDERATVDAHAARPGRPGDAARRGARRPRTRRGHRRVAGRAAGRCLHRRRRRRPAGRRRRVPDPAGPTGRARRPADARARVGRGRRARRRRRGRGARRRRRRRRGDRRRPPGGRWATPPGGDGGGGEPVSGIAARAGDGRRRPRRAAGRRRRRARAPWSTSPRSPPVVPVGAVGVVPDAPSPARPAPTAEPDPAATRAGADLAWAVVVSVGGAQDELLSVLTPVPRPRRSRRSASGGPRASATLGLP